MYVMHWLYVMNHNDIMYLSSSNFNIAISDFESNVLDVQCHSSGTSRRFASPGLAMLENVTSTINSQIQCFNSQLCQYFNYQFSASTHKHILTAHPAHSSCVLLSHLSHLSHPIPMPSQPLLFHELLQGVPSVMGLVQGNQHVLEGLAL